MAIFRPFVPDLVVKNLDGSSIAVVEVKGGMYMSRDYAIDIRRNMLVEGLPAHIPYFLVLSQDLGFLWKDSEQNDLNAPPTYEFPMDEVIKRYSTEEPDRRLPEIELEYVILQWLTSLSIEPQEVAKELEKTLAASGFMNGIKDALVLIEEKL